MRSKVLIAAVLIVAFAAAVFVRSFGGDIKGDIAEAETAILGVLSSRGVSDADLLVREEEYWSRGGNRGKTVKYTFNGVESFSLPGLEKDLRDSVKRIGGVRLDKIEYRADKPGLGTVTYAFKRGRDTIVVLAVKGVPAEWLRHPSDVPGRGEREISGGRKEAGSLAIVLDDCGYSSKNLKAIKDLGVPLTLAVLPNTPYAALADGLAREGGVEIILHLPMEPESPKEKLEKDTVKVSMGKSEIKGIIDRALKQCPSARGVSNHMGSKATKDDAVMRTVIEDLHGRGLYFLDSMTTGDSASKAVCGELGVARAERDVFIDNRDEEGYIDGQMDKIEAGALAGRSIVAIGHDRTLTVKVLAKRIPEMKKKGIKFVFVSDMTKTKREEQ